jgi:hypothetical protein
VLAVAAAALLAFVITLSVLAASAAGRSRKAAAQEREESALMKKPLVTMEELALGAEDFILPALERPEELPQYVPFRPRMKKWSDELAARYWVSPRDIAAEIVGSVNDQNIQRLFQDVK